MPKPPLQFTRPARPEVRTEQRDLRPAPAPTIDLDSPEVQAFSLRGRVTIPSATEDGRGEGPHAITPPSLTTSGEPEPSLLDEPVVDDPWRHVAVKLPAVTRAKTFGDLRCSKRTRVALELLRRPLHDLARAHRAGEYTLLRRVSAGVSRSGVSLILPQDLADDLRHVVETRGAVKAQILARLLVPEIDALYLKEVLHRH